MGAGRDACGEEMAGRVLKGGRCHPKGMALHEAVQADRRGLPLGLFWKGEYIGI